MEKNKLNNDFMEKAMEKAVWKRLSHDFRWNEELLKKYRDKISWNEISKNRNIFWTTSMLEEFRCNIDWNVLSMSISAFPYLFSPFYLKKFEKYWNWKRLSRNPDVTFTLEIIDSFAGKWDWSELISNWGIEKLNLYTEEFLNRYSSYIPGADLQSSLLWSSIITIRQNKLMTDILTQINH